MTTEIDWSKRAKPRKADAGHTLIREGVQKERNRYRVWIECECGKTMSRAALNSWDTTVYYSYMRHVKEAHAERQEAEGAER